VLDFNPYFNALHLTQLRLIDQVLYSFPRTETLQEHSLTS